MRKKSVISDTLHGSITLTDLEREIISHPIFNRLHDIYQNSTVHLTFPSNRTKRFEHSLGTMKLCSDMFTSAICNSDQSDLNAFFEAFKKEFSSIITNLKSNQEDIDKFQHALGGSVRTIKENELPQIPTDDFFQCLPSMCKNESHYTIYYTLLQAIRIAALLHDVGHPPYSHITEFALENIKKKILKKEERNKKEDVFLNLINKHTKNNLEEVDENGKELVKNKKLHESLGDHIAETIFYYVTTPKLQNEKQQDSHQLFKVLICKIVEKIFSNTTPFNTLHRIIDGTLDGDRLDYVARDPMNSGINKGITEFDRLMSGMVLAKVENEYWICPNIKALNTIEDFLHRRWDLYKHIIFHHRVIKTDHILQKVVETLAEDFFLGHLSSENDNYTHLLPQDISGLWLALDIGGKEDTKYALSQWDDAWLKTILKKHFFEKYHIENSLLKKQLDELLTGNKHYYSLIKRLEDFIIIDSCIIEVIAKNKNVIENIISTAKEENKSVELARENPVIEEFENLLTIANKASLRDFKELIFPRIAAISSLPIDIDTILEKAIENAKENTIGKSIDDIFFVKKNFKLGIEEPLFVHRGKDKEVAQIQEISSIAKILTTYYNNFPQFFIYIARPSEIPKQQIDKFLSEVGKNIANIFLENITQVNEESLSSDI